MSDLFPLLMTGVTIGIAYTALPGPVNTEATRRGLNHGFGPALSIQLGSLVGDIGWAVLGLTGAVLTLQRDSVAMLLGIVGAGFLFSLARSAFRAALHGTGEVTEVHPGNGWRIGVMFSVANPAGIAFWSGIGGGTLAASGASGPLPVMALLGGYVASSALAGVILAALAALGRRHATGPVMRWIDGLCGVALSWFGARLLWSTLHRLARWATPLRAALT